MEIAKVSIYILMNFSHAWPILESLVSMKYRFNHITKEDILKMGLT